MSNYIGRKQGKYEKWGPKINYGKSEYFGTDHLEKSQSDGNIIPTRNQFLYLGSTVQEGRAVAQAVSRWLPTAAARVRIRAACGVCGGQSGTGAGLLRVLRFPLPIIPPISLAL
jgi:hypothetical protein